MNSEKLDQIIMLLEGLSQVETSTLTYSDIEGIINPLTEEIKGLKKAIKELSDRISELE